MLVGRIPGDKPPVQPDFCRSEYIELSDKDSMMALISLDTSVYRKNDTWPESSCRTVLDVIDLVQGLYNKYFVVRQAMSGSGVAEDLEKLDRIIEDRKELKEEYPYTGYT